MTDCQRDSQWCNPLWSCGSLPFHLAFAFGFAVVHPNQDVAGLTFERTANFVEDSEFNAV